MFKINIYLKFVLIALFLGGGVLLAMAYGFWYAFPLLLIGLGLLASYFLLGTIASAAEMLQSGDFDGAEKRLEMTKFPKLLYVSNRAFYYILKGSIATNRGDNKTAESLFNTALSLKLPTETERAMVLIQLANINAQKNKWQAAKKYFMEAKKMKVIEPQLKAQIEEFDKVFKQRGQMNAGNMMAAGKQRKGFRQMPSSKRRRPKMR